MTHTNHPSLITNTAHMPASTKANASANVVNVAVAVIYYKNCYLLGFRHAAQHQGNLYEFVGGKIEAQEGAERALIREVAEETGIDVADNLMVKLGRIHHDYGDKQVSLQVYQVELTAEQYEQHKLAEYGLEGQALKWVDRQALLAGEYPLPAANRTILQWLQLPPAITTTYPLAHFGGHTDPAAAWLAYHEQHLLPSAWVYVRLKDASVSRADRTITQLMQQRPDIQVILPLTDGSLSSAEIRDTPTSQVLMVHQSISAYHLTHTELLHWQHSQYGQAAAADSIPAGQPLIVSCHDAESIAAANQLARMRIQQQLPPIIGIFVSPVLFTQTHPDTAPLGWQAWSALTKLADMPVIGLGGLSPSMIDKAKQYGGVSVAGIRQFL
ncbi:NUDIX domain-containing protein [Psychrobacter celer]